MVWQEAKPNDFSCFFFYSRSLILIDVNSRHFYACLDVGGLEWTFSDVFFGQQENNADIDDGKDVTKDVSAESAEDSGQNQHFLFVRETFSEFYNASPVQSV